MRRFLNICLGLLLTSMVGGGCSQQKIIPDVVLSDIFKDAFLVNAYISVKSPNLDSLNIYEPIFEKYGYTVEDVQYTIGNFSKRKSARLGNVVERAITLLEMEGVTYDREVAIIDTIASQSRRMESEVVYQKDEIQLYSQSDTVNVVLNIYNIRNGEYSLRFDYLIDSLDENYGSYRSEMWFKKGYPTEENKLDRHNRESGYLQRKNVLEHRSRAVVNEEFEAMEITLVNLVNKKKEPHVTLRNIEVVYTPTQEAAIQAIYDKMLHVNIFSDELLLPSHNPTDSI
ncbi:MAG: DUF4296 domain-containing protein [Rikenellaceae bacterium]